MVTKCYLFVSDLIRWKIQAENTGPQRKNAADSAGLGSPDADVPDDGFCPCVQAALKTE